MGDFRQELISTYPGSDGELRRGGYNAPCHGRESRGASEIYGQRERPYDMRWGTPEQVKSEFGMGVVTLKSAWASGWVRARQGNWENDDKRTQTIYCFEDIHGFIERVMHRVSEKYAEKWWTDDSVLVMAEKNPDGPYRRCLISKGAKVRKDGFARLPKNPVD